MAKIYWVTCPKCRFRYYVSKELLDIPGIPTLCPKCHHEYPPEESATPVQYLQRSPVEKGRT